MASIIPFKLPELIALIFKFALNLPRRPLDSKGRQFFKILRDVCREWRATGFQTPELWRSLDINLGITKPSSVEAWFRRGGEHSHPALIVRACPSGYEHVPEGLTLQSLQPILKRYRWSCICLYDGCEVYSVSELAGLYEACRPSHNTLHTLALQTQVALRDKWPHITTSAFPKLRDLIVGHQNGPESLVISHAYLTSLHLDFFGGGQGLGKLAFSQIMDGGNLPSLQELIVDWFSPRAYEPFDPLVPVKCNPSVTTLVLASRTSIDAMQYLAFPSLQLLRLIRMPQMYHHYEYPKHFYDFLRRSKPAVLSVEDSMVAVDPADPPLGLQLPDRFGWEACRSAGLALRQLNIRDLSWAFKTDVANREFFPMLEQVTVMSALPPVPSPLYHYLEATIERNAVHWRPDSVRPPLIVSVPRSPTNLDYIHLLGSGKLVRLKERRETEKELPLLSYGISSYLYHDDRYSTHL